MTARELINMMETYLPDLNAQLECKLLDTGELCEIWVAGGEKKVTLFISKKHTNENTTA